MKTGTLSNGMKVVIASVSMQEVISIGMFFRVGSQNETKNTNGITHLLEHVIAKQFFDDCSKVGGHTNALTTKEYCCFFSKCLNYQFKLILDCFRRICDDIYSDTDILHAKKIVMNEIQNLDIEQTLDQRIFQAHLEEDPLRFLPMGAPESIKRLSSDDLHSHFEKHIRPAECVLSIVGGVDEDEGMAVVDQLFAGWYETLEQTDSVFPGVSVQERKEKILISDSKISSLRILFDGTSRISKNKAACSLFCNFLGGGTHSQLFKLIREKWSLAYNAFCVPQFFSRRGIIYLKVVGISDEGFDVMEKISSILQDLTTKEISSEDIERCKRKLIEEHIFKHETLSSKMTLLGQQLLLDGYISTDKDIINTIDQVKLEDVRLVLNHLLSGNITVLLDSSIKMRKHFIDHFT